jgi:hypothetical protein
VSSKELFRRVDRLESGDLLPDIQVVAELDPAGQGDEGEGDDALLVATGVPPASPSAAPSSYRGPLAVELYREPDEAQPAPPRVGAWPDDELDAEGDVEAQPMPDEPVERPSSLNPAIVVGPGRSIVDDPLHGHMALAEWLGRVRR